MLIPAQLSVLESSGLVTISQTEPELEYLFRHTLIQEVAYASLLKTERVQLHRLTGEVLEALYPDHPDDLAPRLAEHYWQAGEYAKALNYLLQAAESAAGRYATAEAIEAYSRALDAAQDDRAARQRILAARGRLYEATGEFEHSRADLEQALQLARETGEGWAEWRAMIDLGLLWAARDYRQTGKYYRMALRRARQIGDDQMIAHSLNRLGNYDINIDQPQRSYRHHREALAVFSRLKDDEGLAETLDLLGMANALGGDLIQAQANLEQAAALFEAVGNRRGAISSRVTQAVMTLDHQTETVVTAGLSTDDAIRIAQKAQREAASIGWRAGEIYSLCSQAFCLAARGDFEVALATAHHGLSLAEEIHHRQWELFIRLASGITYLDLMDYSNAEDCLKLCLDIALEINSAHWLHTACAILATVHMERGDLAGAEALLAKYPLDEDQVHTLGQRLMWCASAELALEQGDPRRALEINNRLVASAMNLSSQRAIHRLWRSRALILATLACQTSSPEEKAAYEREAEMLLHAAIQEGDEKHFYSRLWRAWLALARLHTQQGRETDALQAWNSARDSLDDLAAKISDPGLRRAFRRRAAEKMKEES